MSVIEAIVKGNPDEVKKFLKNGGNPNTPTKDGESLLVKAILHQKSEIADLLIEAGADLNSKITNGYYEGYTPLQIAIETGMLSTAKKLIEKGANVKEKTPYGATALHIIAGVSGIGQKHSFQIARELVKRGADVNAKDSKGNTPLHYASQIGNSHIVRVLVELGADVNQKNSEGNTPLILALMNRHLKTVEILLKSGANPSIENLNKENAFKLAKNIGNDNLTNLLKSTQHIKTHWQNFVNGEIPCLKSS